MSTVIEEVTLNWTDLTGKKTGASKLGSNKFSKATITEAGGGFTVTFNYGRVGASGQTQTVQCSSVDEAKRQMEKKIRAKISKGYTKIDLRSEDEEKAKSKAKGIDVGDKKKKKKKAKKSREFHKNVDSLIRFMYSSTGKAIAKGLSSSAGASEDAPLGNSRILSSTRERTCSSKSKRCWRKNVNLAKTLLSTSPTIICRPSREILTTHAREVASI
ncbi:MAG: WGR domain-containing protein [Deltaproteobacteria bacterium]|nr:WGR domain-containing protein [Deltaproteobacteria bacterium]